MLDVRRILLALPTKMMNEPVNLGRQGGAGAPDHAPQDGPRGRGGDHEQAEEMRLAEAIARGETDAFDVFYRRNVDRLYRVIYYQLNAQRADAEDVLQETMMAAVKSMPSYRGQARLFTWLCGIAQHKITDHRRRRGAHGEKVALPLQDGDSSLPDGGELVQDAETRVLVRQALSALSESHRQVLILKYVAGLSVEEIAVSTGRSFKAVESLLSRAREGLRLALASETIYVKRE